MGLDKLQELEERNSELEELYKQALRARDTAIEERDKATVLIALQLEKESSELNKQIKDLRSGREKLLEENEDLKVRLQYAREDLGKLQQKHISLQLELEQFINEKEDAIENLKRLEVTRENELGSEVQVKDKKENVEAVLNELESIEEEVKVVMDNTESPPHQEMKEEVTNTDVENLELEPRPPITLKTSKVEDHYIVHGEVGKGKFGVVKKVTEKSTNTIYAAKYIKLSSICTRDDVMKEIDIMSKLHHKRLVGLVDGFDSPRDVVMIMDFISGGELFERVAENDCLTEKEGAYYMHQLLQGLQHMHKKNIVHLDLKPENIVCVSKDSWDIKLIDFGLAQVLVPGQKLKGLKGTPEFMAPEAVNFDSLSLGTDMWGVGVIAYILLSGLSPFMGDDDNETLSNVTAADWDFDDESFDVISDEAKDFITQLLRQNPGERNTVEESLAHAWMQKTANADSAAANAVKINTQKLKQFLAKRRWQKSVNALVAVRRLSSSLNMLSGLKKPRASIAPSLPTVMAAKDDSSEGNQDIPAVKLNAKKPTLRAPVFLKDLEDVAVSIGNSVTLEVVIGGDPQCEIEWFMNGMDLTEGGRHSFVNGGDGHHSLVIRDVTDDDEGQYCCAAQNGTGRVTCDGYVTVEEDKEPLDPPEFELELSDMTAHEGETVSLDVVVQSASECKLEWFKDGVDVEESDRHSFVDHGDGQHSLLIQDAEEDDTGEYCCVAENPGGRTTCAGYLTIEEDIGSLEPPVFDKELNDVTIKEGETISLDVVVSGDLECELEWFKNAVDVVEGERHSFIDHGEGKHSLVIRNVEDDDTGEYCCVAQNKAGRVTCAGYMTVEVENSDLEIESDASEEETEIQNVVIREDKVDKYYAIEEEVGRGRFGIVKKCVHLDTATHYCAKYIKTRPSQKEEAKKEVDTMNLLHHPRLIRLHEAFEEPRQIVLILEYARGGDLLSRLAEPLPEEEALHIMRQIVEAVKFMHDRSIMHLDLKPQNVMFKNEGGSKIKVIDFSLSRKFDTAKEARISYGTAEYVAPEVLSYEPVSLATDMWAVGVMGYMMVSGQSPFLGESEADTFRLITDARWDFTEEFNHVSREVKDFLKRLIVKDPKKRMTASECTEHPWIKGESSVDENSNMLINGQASSELSSTAEGEPQDFTDSSSLDSRELEKKLKKLLVQVNNLQSEKEELEKELNEERERVESLEDDIDDATVCQKELEGKLSKLESENKTLASRAKTNQDQLLKFLNLEGERRHLEEKLLEESKARETLEKKCRELKGKIEDYEMLEDKVYRLGRERKVSNDMKQQLLVRIEDYEAERQELIKIQEENNAVNEMYEQLRREKDELESIHRTCSQERETAIAALEEKQKLITEEKNLLKESLGTLTKENEELTLKLGNSITELGELEGKLHIDLKNELSQAKEVNGKLKKHKEETQKTCEQLASKLSKAYTDLERIRRENSKALEPGDLEGELSHLKERVSSLEEEKERVENDLNHRDTELNQLNGKYERLTKEYKSLLTTTGEENELQSKLEAAMEQSNLLEQQLAKVQGDNKEREDSTIAALKSEIVLLQRKLDAKAQGTLESEEKVISQKKENQLPLQEDLVTFQEVQSSECTPLSSQGYEGVVTHESEFKPLWSDEINASEVKNQLNTENVEDVIEKEESSTPYSSQSSVIEERGGSAKESFQSDSSLDEGLVMADKEEHEGDDHSGKYLVGRTQLQKRIQEVERYLEKQTKETEDGRQRIQNLEKTLNNLEIQNKEDSQKLLKLQSGLETILSEHKDSQPERATRISTPKNAGNNDNPANISMQMADNFTVPINEQKDKFLDEVPAKEYSRESESELLLKKRLRELQEDFEKHVTESSETRKTIAILQREALQLLDERKELWYIGKTLRKEHACLKEELQIFETRLTLELSEVEKLKAKVEFLEKEREESTWNYSMLERELEKVKSEMKAIIDDFALERNKSEALKNEVQDLMDTNHEALQSRLAVERKVEHLEKNVWELEDELEYESQNHAKTKKTLSNLTKENKNMETQIRTLQEEASKMSQAFLELKEQKHSKSKVVKELTQNVSVAVTKEKNLESSLVEERRKSESLEQQKFELEGTITALKEDIKIMIQEDEKEKTAMDKELHELRPLREKANTLERELREVKGRQERDSRDEDDTLRCELETMRHRLVSNVIKPLEEARLPCGFRVNAADISQGKNKAWSRMKEALTALIKDREMLNEQNAKLYQAWSRLTYNYQTKLEECEALETKLNQNCEKLENLRKNSEMKKQGLNIETKYEHRPASIKAENEFTESEQKDSQMETSRMELQSLRSELQVHEEEIKELKKQKETLRGQLEEARKESVVSVFPTTQTGSHEFPEKKSYQRDGNEESSLLKPKIAEVCATVQTNAHDQPREGEYKIQLKETSDSLEPAVIPSDAKQIVLEALANAQVQTQRYADLAEELGLARELGIGDLSTASPETSGQQNEAIRIEVERLKEEKVKLLKANSELSQKLVGDNSSAALLQKELNELETLNAKLSSEKDDLVLGSTAKEKQVLMMEKENEALRSELRTRKLSQTGKVVHGREEVTQHGELDEYNETLKTARQREAHLLAELEQFQNQYQHKLQESLDEMEVKWTKRLRKECMALQAELSEKHSIEKRIWLKKEADLQNVIRQMKLLMDKRAEQAEQVKTKLEQELHKARVYTGSSLSLDSVSDESGDTPNANGGTGLEAATNFLSDRELRRVAYKLTGEEWSQLGTFLGFGDKELLQLTQLSIGGQEKAFQLLCNWRTRSKLNRNQMVSQLAVSLEEISRKDVAQFVLEQFMSGKGRKKFFGW